MTNWHVRSYDTTDHTATVRLLEEVRSDAEGPSFDLTDTVLALREDTPAVVAVTPDQFVGVAVAKYERGHAQVLALAIAPAWRYRGIGSALLQALENQLLHAGHRRITTLLAPGQFGELAFRNRGFSKTGLTLYEKYEPLRPADVTTVERWGGTLLTAAEWHGLAGMADGKRLVEQRLLLPIKENELAETYGVVTPTAMLLFGPPGTGKTSFARAVAARLEWPFVELLPSRLVAAGGGNLAAELRTAITDLMQVERVVVFIDEVDEIAQSRDAVGPESQSVVNELLKAIPQFRSAPGRLLICATNSIAALDPAFIRPGRFDLVLPVGPPDAPGRRLLLDRFLERIDNKQVDIEPVVAATELFTPADLAATVQRAVAAAFHRAVDRGERLPVTTDDLLAAARSSRPTISSEELERFRADAKIFTRS
ncbi:GNAT family N-acetyltransferase [Candidatus Protofrankia californiensis]|uniref:GNAT family N-acetyltransferase n=1 Tax=Candidatus Protofrankia californiensis TaxID=1839754 RepID=UPI001040F4D1|nr:GNAT family N-acetyltransferase [Candidatus Protofrankia californiensis]